MVSLRWWALAMVFLAMFLMLASSEEGFYTWSVWSSFKWFIVRVIILKSMMALVDWWSEHLIIRLIIP